MRCKSQQTEFLNAVAHRCQPFASLIWQIPGACSAAKQAASNRVVCVPWDQPPHNVYLTIAHCFHFSTFPSVDYTSCRAPCTWQRRITIRKWPSLLSLSINLRPSLSSNKRKISLVHFWEDLMVFESGERVWKEEKCGLREAKKRKKLCSMHLSNTKIRRGSCLFDLIIFCPLQT